MDASKLLQSTWRSQRGTKKYLPTRHLHSYACEEHQKIQESEVGFPIPRDFVLPGELRDSSIVAGSPRGHIEVDARTYLETWGLKFPQTVGEQPVDIE